MGRCAAGAGGAADNQGPLDWAVSPLTPEKKNLLRSVQRRRGAFRGLDTGSGTPAMTRSQAPGGPTAALRKGRWTPLRHRRPARPSARGVAASTLGRP